MKRKSFLAVMSLLAVMLVSSAYADAISIIDLGEGNYTTAGDNIIRITGSDGQTIMNAINVIPSGGTIVLNGNFKINSMIKIKKPLTLCSSLNGAVLDGQGKIRVLRCQGQGIVLENLTVINGFETGTMQNFQTPGGGINIASCSIDIINCNIINNEGFNGGGIFCGEMMFAPAINNSVRMNNCVISDNRASGQGGGVHVQSGVIELNNCTISGNEAIYYGGGTFCIKAPSRFRDSNPKITLRDSKITGNTATGKGGGICNTKIAGLAAGTAEAWNCEISGNTPDDISGEVMIDGVVFSATHNSDVSESETDSPVSDSSGGGCNAPGIGFVAMAVIFINRKVIRNA